MFHLTSEPSAKRNFPPPLSCSTQREGANLNWSSPEGGGKSGTASGGSDGSKGGVVGAAGRSDGRGEGRGKVFGFGALRALGALRDLDEAPDVAGIAKGVAGGASLAKGEKPSVQRSEDVKRPSGKKVEVLSHHAKLPFCAPQSSGAPSAL